MLLHLLTAGFGTLLPRAEAVSCPQLAKGDIGALADRSAFDPTAVISRVEIPQRSSLLPSLRCAILPGGSTGGIGQ